MSQNIFVDTHIHFFNFVDIPVYETLEGKVSVNIVTKMLAAFSASSALLGGGVRKNVEVYKEFIKFFERPQEANIRGFLHGAAQAIETELLVFNPLVMDFDCARQACGDGGTCSDRPCPLQGALPASVSQDPSVEMQLLRLQATIRLLERSGQLPEHTTVKVFPFLGFDLRKLTPINSTAMIDLQEIWATVGRAKSDRRKGFAGIENGKVLGVKLYPPIGFNPYPENRAALALYKEFYEWCIEEKVPLTVHCQDGSFSAGRKQSRVNRDTHSRNWLKLFEGWGAGELESDYDIDELKINFAHFGGEDGLEDMLDPLGSDGIDENSWSHDIVKIITRYTGAYTDISAFDWSSGKTVRNFAKLLDYDKGGKLGAGEYTVTEKILWGSDVPMVLDSNAYKKNTSEYAECGYGHLFDNFKEVVYSAEVLNEGEKQEVISHITGTAPVKFMLG